jgi:hypothetical protein
MFTVLNMDVKSSAYLSACVCFLIIPLFLNARDLGTRNRVPANQYGVNDIHESYEDYMSDSVDRIDTINFHEKSIKHQKKKRLPAREYSTYPKNTVSYIQYRVKRKDTLTRIAKKFNITVSAIQKHNRLNDTNSISAGMTIKIPRFTHGRDVKKASNNPFCSTSNARPRFRWPLSRIVMFKNDGLDGVKPIGIIITSTPGSKVISSAPGTVKKIGSMRGFGKYIVINHAGRFNTVYSNLGEIHVSPGDTVECGNTIGRIHSSDNKLHFQIDHEGKPENPLNYLPKKM